MDFFGSYGVQFTESVPLEGRAVVVVAWEDEVAGARVSSNGPSFYVCDSVDLFG